MKFAASLTKIKIKNRKTSVNGHKRPYFSKPSYWRFMASLKCVAEEGGTFLPKNWPPENTDLLEAERG